MKAKRKKTAIKQQSARITKTSKNVRRKARTTAASPAATNAVNLKEKSTCRSIVLEALGRTEGASLAELSHTLGWQKHSVSAILTGLRHTGHTILRSRDKGSESRYWLESPA